MLLFRDSQTAVLPRRPPIQQRLQTRNRNGHDGGGHFEHTQDVCAQEKASEFNPDTVKHCFKGGLLAQWNNLQTRFSCPVPTISVMKRIMQISAGARPSAKVK